MSVLRVLATFLALMLARGSDASAARMRRPAKARDYLKKGREAEVRKQWETALDFYEKAMLEDPADAAYQLSAKRVRFQAAMARVDAGQKLRSAGQLEEALAEFQKAYAIDPSNSMAEQELKRTKDMIEREKNPARALRLPPRKSEVSRRPSARKKTSTRRSRA